MTDGKSTTGWPKRTRESMRQEVDPAADDAARGAEDAATAPGAEGLTLQEVVWTWASELRRSWRLALFAFAIGVAPMFSCAVFSIPNYTATGVVQVTSMTSVNPLQELTGGGSASVETEIELMRRREFLLAVFKDLRLNVADPNQPVGTTLDLSISLRGRSPISPSIVEARAAVAVAQVKPDHAGDVPLRVHALDPETMEIEVGDGGPDDVYLLRVGERLDTSAFELAFAHLPVAVGSNVALVLRADGSLVDELQSSLSVSMVGSRTTPTNLVRVAFLAPDRALAQRVVARLMDRYVEEALSWQTASASRSVKFISKQLEAATKQLSDSEQALKQFSETERTVQLETQAQTTVEKVAELEAERLQANLQEKLMDNVLGEMGQRLERGSTLLTANFFDDPVLAASITALTENETRYEVLKATLTRSHPQVIELGAQIRQQQQQVARLMRSARRNLTTRTEELERQIRDTASSLETYPEKQLRLAQLMRAVAVAERLYSFLLEKQNEARIIEASTTTDKRVVDAASYPHRITTPRRGRMIATGLAAGLIFALAAVYIARTLRRTLGSVEAITSQVHYPVYGMIPALVPPPADETVVLGATWLRGPNATAEAARALAVSLRLGLAPAAGRGRIVQMTSSGHGEGKSSVAANLAIALARMGVRVLLVDLDLRNPTQQRLWRVQRAPGYVDLVTSASDPELARRIMHRDATHRVSVLTAGSWTAETTALLMGEQLQSMLASWTAEYDYILVDGPPAFVPDTWVVARLADLLLLVARPGALERGELRRSLDLLARIPTRKGLVLHAVTSHHLGFGASGLKDFDKYRLGKPEPDVDDFELTL